MRIQTSRWLSDDGAQPDEHLAGRRLRIRHVLVARAPPGRRPRGSALPAPGGTLPCAPRGAGAARRGARARRRRRDARGRLRGDRAPHPRAPGARALRRHAVHDGAARALVPSGDAAARRADRRLGRALLLRARARAAAPGAGRLPRYTWFDGYAELRAKLDELGRRLGGEYRVLRRREPARRPRGGRAQRCRLLRQEHAADHAPPRLVGRARHARHRRSSSSRRRRSTPTAARAASASTPARRTRSTSRGRSTRRVPLLLDAGAARRSRSDYREQLGAQVYGCDICQDVCPWNRGVEKRRAGETPPREAHVSLVDWLEGTTTSCARATTVSSSRATTAAG